MSTTSSLASSTDADKTHFPSRRLTATYLLLICQLLLLTKVIQVFAIEERRNLFALMCLVTGGFIIHHRLPARFRSPFFLFLSLTAMVLILGWLNAACAFAIGAALLAICHLPVGIVWRGVLLAVTAVGLAYVRRNHSFPFWPVVASMFMFRLPIYFREMRHTGATISQRFSYFFLLPNVCFPFFPIVDFQLFLNSFHRDDDDQTAQQGVGWIWRGIVHLVLYRLVKYHLLVSPEDILNIEDTVWFLAANYALYLRVSGTFHLITGVLHLFGHNLPRTHDCYFLAHSFTDIWRRINIYWKDFLTQHIFLPAFFRLRTRGNRLGIAAAIIVVFGCTWLLHSYQVFWLLGDFPLRSAEAILWLVAGVIVAANAILDYQAARRGSVPHSHWTWIRALRRSCQIVFVFFSVSIFWACWTYPPVLLALVGVANESPGFWTGWHRVAAAIVALIVGGTSLQLIPEPWRNGSQWRLGSWSFGSSWKSSPWPVLAASTGALILAQPSFQGWFHTDTARVLASLSVDYPTTLDLARSVPGYYEELADADLQSNPLTDIANARPAQGELLYSAITRPRSDLLEIELIPRWKGTLAGAPLSINRWGMRDGPVDKEKPAGTQRIALVGSSVVMGFGVRDQEVFSEILERRLNTDPANTSHYEFLNFGVGRYYVLHIASLLREKVFAFQPDAVYYVAHQGELFGPVPHVAKCSFERQRFPYPCLDQIIADVGITSETSWGTTQRLLQPHAKEITFCVYRGIVADCEERGILPVWIYLPMPGIIEVTVNGQELIRLAQEAGFTVLDLSHWADGRQPSEVKLSAGDYHANAEGHRVIAEQLFETLQKNPRVLPRE